MYLMKRQIPLNEGHGTAKDHMQIHRYVLAGVEQKKLQNCHLSMCACTAFCEIHKIFVSFTTYFNLLLDRRFNFQNQFSLNIS